MRQQPCPDQQSYQCVGTPFTFIQTTQVTLGVYMVNSLSHQTGWTKLLCSSLLLQPWASCKRANWNFLAKRPRSMKRNRFQRRIPAIILVFGVTLDRQKTDQSDVVSTSERPLRRSPVPVPSGDPVEARPKLLPPHHPLPLRTQRPLTSRQAVHSPPTQDDNPAPNISYRMEEPRRAAPTERHAACTSYF
jgi:hypothetical protein